MLRQSENGPVSSQSHSATMATPPIRSLISNGISVELRVLIGLIILLGLVVLIGDGLQGRP